MSRPSATAQCIREQPRSTLPRPPPARASGTTVTRQPLSSRGGEEVAHSPYENGAALEYLESIEQLLVHQKRPRLGEAFGDCKIGNKFEIKDDAGRRVFFATEIRECCAGPCFASSRFLQMEVADNFDNEFIHMVLPYTCCTRPALEVCCPPGNLVGFVQQEMAFCTPQFSVKDAAGVVMMRIQGPEPCTCLCCTDDVDFKIMRAGGSRQVGVITKKWSGLAREMFTAADDFGISFPKHLDAPMKAVLIGACILIDFMYYDHRND